MSNENENPIPKSFLGKLSALANKAIDDRLIKAEAANYLEQQRKDSDDFLFSKAVVEDPHYAIHSAGWKEKPHRIQNSHLKQMAKSDTVMAAIIQTRCNQVSGFSRYVKSEKDKGWVLKLKDEDKLLEEIKDELRNQGAENDQGIEQADQVVETTNDDVKSEVSKQGYDRDVQEDIDWDLERKAKAVLRETYRKDKANLANFIKQCGIPEEGHEKPFYASRWNFDDLLRAWVRDTLTYDIYAMEAVPDQKGDLSYFMPVDGSTVYYSSNRFNDYKYQAESSATLNLLYPDKEAKNLQESGRLDLDDEKVKNGEYQWVQVVNGKIERAFTDQELKVGIRNPTTDIYNNGYGVSEMELCVALVTGHINAEYYNQAYFTQGFSAKGILHIKSALNRRKLETVRQEWRHMLSGARNSFRTPIFAGVDDVAWIPLTQNHDDIGFEGWMRYLVKMMCAIYQIDPAEIGVPFKDEGGGGGNLGGDNTREKLTHSKDKGLYPLLRHIENFVNSNILAHKDDRFELFFTGITEETAQEALDRQEKESKFLKTVNELRAEHDLPPIPDCDTLILNPAYIQYMSQQQMQGDMQGGEEEPSGFDQEVEDSGLYNTPEDGEEDPNQEGGNEFEDSGLYKSQNPKHLKIEYFTLGDS